MAAAPARDAPRPNPFTTCARRTCLGEALAWYGGRELTGSPLAGMAAGEATDVATTGYMSRHGKHAFEWRSRSLTFYTSSYCVRKDGQDDWHDLSAILPDDVDVSHFADQLLISLRKEWRGHKGGALLAVDMEDLVTNKDKANFHVLFEPSERISLETYSTDPLPWSILG